MLLSESKGLVGFGLFPRKNDKTDGRLNSPDCVTSGKFSLFSGNLRLFKGLGFKSGPFTVRVNS